MTATPIKASDPYKDLVKPLTDEQRGKALAMLQEWCDDESGYDEKAWPELKEALNRERDAVGARRLFDD